MDPQQASSNSAQNTAYTSAPERKPAPRKNEEATAKSASKDDCCNGICRVTWKPNRTTAVA